MVGDSRLSACVRDRHVHRAAPAEGGHGRRARCTLNLRLRYYIILSVQRRCPHKPIIERKLRIIIIIHHPYSRTGTLTPRESEHIPTLAATLRLQI